MLRLNDPRRPLVQVWFEWTAGRMSSCIGLLVLRACGCLCLTPDYVCDGSRPLAMRVVRMAQVALEPHACLLAYSRHGCSVVLLPRILWQVVRRCFHFLGRQCLPACCPLHVLGCVCLLCVSAAGQVRHAGLLRSQCQPGLLQPGAGPTGGGTQVRKVPLRPEFLLYTC
jgi:hypothetical protein